MLSAEHLDYLRCYLDGEIDDIDPSVFAALVDEYVELAGDPRDSPQARA